MKRPIRIYKGKKGYFIRLGKIKTPIKIAKNARINNLIINGLIMQRKRRPRKRTKKIAIANKLYDQNLFRTQLDNTFSLEKKIRN